MPADDAIKDTVVAALQKDGWTITHDPLTLDYEEVSVAIDLGSERLLAAEEEWNGLLLKSNLFPELHRCENIAILSANSNFIK
jgi:hypothetical protein